MIEQTVLSKELLLGFYRQMVLIRRFEDKAAEMYTLGKIGGFLHLYNGEEAVAVGAISVLRPEDHIFTHYRDHGHALARGMDPRRVMAELFGKATGVSRGRGGSMHLADPSLRFWGGYAIVGGHIPLACGMALAVQYRGADEVVLCIFGDGATNIGEFHEGLNLAALWKLPVIFLCENNFYGMGTHVRRAASTPEIYRRAEVYGIRSEQVDGMDVLAVRDAMTRAMNHVRGGNGPYFIEALTYRFRGHSMADPELYRSREEVEEWRRQRDPIVRFSAYLTQNGYATADELAAIEQEVEAEVEEAVRFAEESPEPPLESVTEYVYVNPGPARRVAHA
jgi:pyruvate dehydrogenase E1 component alpha subunit